jgi:hypothetical protein
MKLAEEAAFKLASENQPKIITRKFEVCIHPNLYEIGNPYQ